MRIIQYLRVFEVFVNSQCHCVTVHWTVSLHGMDRGHGPDGCHFWMHSTRALPSDTGVVYGLLCSLKGSFLGSMLVWGSVESRIPRQGLQQGLHNSAVSAEPCFKSYLALCSSQMLSHVHGHCQAPALPASGRNRAVRSVAGLTLRQATMEPEKGPLKDYCPL